MPWYILYYTVLYDTMLYYTIQYYTILYYTILYYTVPYSTSTILYTILDYTGTILYYTILHYTISFYSILHYAILCYSKHFSAQVYCTLYPTHTIPYHVMPYNCIRDGTILYQMHNSGADDTNVALPPTAIQQMVEATCTFCTGIVRREDQQRGVQPSQVILSSPKVRRQESGRGCGTVHVLYPASTCGKPCSPMVRGVLPSSWSQVVCATLGIGFRGRLTGWSRLRVFRGASRRTGLQSPCQTRHPATWSRDLLGLY